MYIQLNLEQVVVSATEELSYVAINPTTHKKYITKDVNEAVGILGSDSKVRPLANCNLLEEWDSIVSVVEVSSLPEDFEPNKYKFEDNEFVLYEGTVPNDNYELTQSNEKMMADIDYIAMMTDVEIPTED